MSDEVKCPKCGSSSVDASLSGANLGMAALGTYSFGTFQPTARSASIIFVRLFGAWSERKSLSSCGVGSKPTRSR
jgi:hypothetical protein